MEDDEGHNEQFDRRPMTNKSQIQPSEVVERQTSDEQHIKQIEHPAIARETTCPPTLRRSTCIQKIPSKFDDLVMGQ